MRTLAEITVHADLLRRLQDSWLGNVGDFQGGRT